MNSFFQEVYKQYNSICQDALIKSKDLRVPFQEFIEILHKHDIKAEQNPQCSFLIQNAKEGDLVDTKLFLNCVVKTVSKDTYSHDQFTIDLFWESKFQASQKHVDLDQFNKEFFDFFKVMLKRDEISKILNECFNYLLKKGKEQMSKRILKKVVQKGYQKLFDDIFQSQDAHEANKENQHFKNNTQAHRIDTFPDSLDLKSTGNSQVLQDKTLDRLSHFQGTSQSKISEIVQENSSLNKSRPPSNKKDLKNSTFNTANFLQSTVNKQPDPVQVKRLRNQSAKLIFFSLQRLEQKDNSTWLKFAFEAIKPQEFSISSIQKGEHCLLTPQLYNDSGLGLKQANPVIYSSSLVSDAQLSGLASTKQEGTKGVFSFNHSIEDWQQRNQQKQSMQTNTLTYSNNTNSNVNFLSLHQVPASIPNSGHKTPTQSNVQKPPSSGISTYNQNYPSDNQFPPSSWRQEKTRQRVPFQELNVLNQLPTTNESSHSQLKLNSAKYLETQLYQMREQKQNIHRMQSSNNDISQQTRRSYHQTCVLNQQLNSNIHDQSSLSEINFCPQNLERNKKIMTQEFEQIPKSRRSSQAPTQHYRGATGSKTQSELSMQLKERNRSSKTRNRDCHPQPPSQFLDQSYLIDESNFDGPTHQTKSFVTNSTIPTHNNIPRQRKSKSRKRQSIEREQQMYILETPGQLISSGVVATDAKRKRTRTNANNSAQREYDSIRMDSAQHQKRALSHSKDYHSKYKKLKHRFISLSTEIVKHKERAEIGITQLGSNFERIQHENVVLKNQLQTIKEQNLECTQQLTSDLKKKSLFALCLKKIIIQNGYQSKFYFWWKQQVANSIQLQVIKEKASRQVGRKRILFLFQNWKYWAHKSRATKIKKHNKKLQLKVLKSVCLQKERKERTQVFSFWYKVSQRERETCFFQDLEQKDSQIRRLTLYISLAQITSTLTSAKTRVEREVFQFFKSPAVEPPTLGHTMLAGEFMSTGFGGANQQILCSMNSNQVKMGGTMSGQNTVKGYGNQDREIKFQSTGKINYQNALSPTYAHHQTQQINQATLGTLNSHAINPLISVGNGSQYGPHHKLMMTQGTRELSPTQNQEDDKMSTLARRESVQQAYLRIQEQKYNTFNHDASIGQNNSVQTYNKFQNRSVGNSVAKKEPNVTNNMNSKMNVFQGIEKMYTLKKKQFQKLKRLAIRQWNQKAQFQSMQCENLATFAKQKTSHSHMNSYFSSSNAQNSSLYSQDLTPKTLKVQKHDPSPCFKKQVFAGEFDLQDNSLEPQIQEQVPQPVNQKQVGGYYRTNKGFFLVDLNDPKKAPTITSNGSTMSDRDDPMPSFGRGRTKDQAVIFNQQCVLGQRSASIGGQKHRYNNESRLSGNFLPNDRPTHSVAIANVTNTPQRTAASSRYESSENQKEEFQESQAMKERSKSVGKQRNLKAVPKEDLQKAIAFLKAQVQL